MPQGMGARRSRSSQSLEEAEYQVEVEIIRIFFGDTIFSKLIDFGDILGSQLPVLCMKEM